MSSAHPDVGLDKGIGPLAGILATLALRGRVHAVALAYKAGLVRPGNQPTLLRP